MDCIKIKELIQLYHDGELEKSREPFLFVHLSCCEDCRLFFKQMNNISSYIKKEEFPAELEDKIFNSIKNAGRKNENIYYKKLIIPALTYAALFLLIATGIFFYFKMNEYKSEMTVINRQLQYQSQTIELLYNSLSPTVAHANYSHEIIIKAKL